MSQYRDMSKQYSKEEEEGLKKIFRSLPTWDGNQIKVTDIPELILKMKYERTPDQVAAYQNYWIEKHGGKLTLDQFINSAKTIHDTALFAADYVKLADKDNNGFIDASEFKDVLALIRKHSPKFASTGMTFEDFLNAADTNNDGRISNEECANWIKGVLDKEM